MAGNLIALACAGLLLAGLNAAEAAPSDLRAARSLVAEAALLLRLDAQHRVTATYAAQTQDMIRDQLRSEMQNLEPRPGALVRAALGAIKARDPQALSQIQQQLTLLVNQREQAD